MACLKMQHQVSTSMFSSFPLRSIGTVMGSDKCLPSFVHLKITITASDDCAHLVDGEVSALVFRTFESQTDIMCPVLAQE